MTNDKELTSNLLHFMLQNVRMCVELQYVDKVILLPMIQSLPSSPPYITGLVNISGQSIEIIDLAILLGLERVEDYKIDTPLIICSSQQQKVGIVVDKILELVSDHQTLQMEENFSEPDALFHGVVKFNNELSLLINLDKIMDVTFSATAVPVNTAAKITNFVEKSNE